MNFKDYLQSLEWRSFSCYPTYGEDVYIHCYTEDDVHLFFKVKAFNVVSFDCMKLVKNYETKKTWQFSWLPVKLIKKSNDSEFID